ncbi:hypothetical protein [Polluticaenibacter yanchengensis]|uniref:DUF4149 domain-containing protein n=1 Tax=Polluticaenibacter yanchengensis TaxID=3014562 RepID=A0ABT4UKE3_9BACT|nr:hypothetical protein [Chitinophagaceae bacterium LY-5]
MKLKIAIAFIFIWIGCIVAISFMEAWLKFRAPGVTLPIGLGIGRLVFGMLNKVEWVLLFITTFGIIEVAGKSKTAVYCFSAAAIILLLQTFWLLPALDARAQQIIDGKSITASNHHLIFAILEVIKFTVLFITGFGFLKHIPDKS